MRIEQKKEDVCVRGKEDSCGVRIVCRNTG